jgi:hypothetical protein
MLVVIKYADGTTGITRTTAKFTGNGRSLALAIAGQRKVRTTYQKR